MEIKLPKDEYIGLSDSYFMLKGTEKELNDLIDGNIECLIRGEPLIKLPKKLKKKNLLKFCQNDNR